MTAPMIKLVKRQRPVLERDVQAGIRLAVNRLPFARVLRNNTGVLRDVRDVPVFYGLGEGSPDLVGVIKIGPFPFTFAIEVKRPGRKPTKKQLLWHRFARKWGIVVIVATEAAYAVAEVKRLHARLALEVGLRLPAVQAVS